MPPRELYSGELRRRPAPPSLLSRQICFLRPGLEREPLRPQPPDPDPTDQIRAYRFGLEFFLKSPSSFPYSTRGPRMFKNNYGLALFYSLKPLSSLEIAPLVQPLSFYALAPEFNL